MAKAPQRVYLHVGVPKSGTTFLQSVLAAGRQPLKDAGVLYPGQGPAHFLAAQDLTEHMFLGRDNPKVARAWRKLVKESRRWSETVVISHELFTHCEPQHIKRALADLSPTEFHVIISVRDFERQLPAVWQERLKNGGSVTFERHFEQAQEYALQRPGETLGFWRQQDAVTIMARWAAEIPRERIHVITVPQRGAPKDLLWRRFAQVIGVAPEAIDLATVQTTGNVSLRPPQAKVLRTLNQRLRGNLPSMTYRSVVKRYLSEVATEVKFSNAPYSLTDEQRTQARQWSEELSTNVRDQGYDVVGDLTELDAPQPEPDHETSRSFDEVPAADAAAASVAAAAALVTFMSGSDESAKPPD